MATTFQYTHLPFAFASPGDVLAAGIVLPLMCMLSVVLRFYTRRVQKAAIGADDLLLVPGVILIIGMGVCLIVGYAKRVMGYPTPLPVGSDPKEAYAEYLASYQTEAEIEFYYQLLMIVAYGCIKLSLLFFYRRLFLVVRWSVFDVVSIVYAALVAMWTLAFFFLFLFGCRTRIDMHWAPLQEVQNQCGNAMAPELGLVISDLATDLMILCLPLPIIWRLNLKWTRKVAISCVFLVGLMAIAASIARMVIYIIVSYEGYGAGYDLDQTVTTMLWWSMIEASLGLIAACLPTLSFLTRKISMANLFSRLRSRSSSRSRDLDYQHSNLHLNSDSIPLVETKPIFLAVWNGSERATPSP